MKVWAATVGIGYCVLILSIVGLFSATPGRAAALLLPFLLSGVLFVWGVAARESPPALLARRLGWTGMLLGTIPMVSFSFVLLPLLLSALPAALGRGKSDSCAAHDPAG